MVVVRFLFVFFLFMMMCVGLILSFVVWVCVYLKVV